MLRKDVGFTDVLFCCLKKNIKKVFFIQKSITFTSTNNKTTIKMKTIVTITKGAQVLLSESFTSKKQAENFINKFKASTPVMQRIKEGISIFTR